MLRKIRFIILSGLILISATAFSQEMLGISNSNFAGNMGMGLNPSLFVGSPYLQELNFISADFFVDNDYAFVKKRSRFITKSLTGESIPEDRFGDYYDSKTKNAYSSVFLRGPSFIQNKEKFSWGVHTALRSAVSATDVPFHVAKFIKEGFDYIPQHDQDWESTPFRSAAMLWGELGGTYGRKIYEVRNKKYLAAAVTLKFIAGFDGFYANIDEFDYRLPNSDTLIMYDVTGEYAHAMEDQSEGFKKPLALRGYGFGADIGLTYYKGKVHGSGDCNKSAEILKKYQYRVGLSLIDAGLVMFRNDAKLFTFENASAVWPGIDTVKFPTIMDLDTTLSNQFFSEPGKSQTGDKFNIYLPTALSLQFDYCIAPKFYANATWVQAVPLSKYAIVRSSQIAVSARYETRRFEVTMPLTFYEYTTPHLGIAFRYRFFVIGTDRLGSYTGLWDTTGMDLFFGFKWNWCEKGGKRGNPNCPAYSN